MSKKISLKEIHAVAHVLVNTFHNHDYCFCPTCCKGFVLITHAAFCSEVNCSKSVHYPTSAVLESYLKKDSRK